MPPSVVKSIRFPYNLWKEKIEPLEVKLKSKGSNVNQLIVQAVEHFISKKDEPKSTVNEVAPIFNTDLDLEESQTEIETKDPFTQMCETADNMEAFVNKSKDLKGIARLQVRYKEFLESLRYRWSKSQKPGR